MSVVDRGAIFEPAPPPLFHVAGCFPQFPRDSQYLSVVNLPFYFLIPGMVFKDQRFPSLFVRCGVTNFVCSEAQQKHCRPLQIFKSFTSNVEWNFSAFYVIHYEHGSVTSAF